MKAAPASSEHAAEVCFRLLFGCCFGCFSLENRSLSVCVSLVVSVVLCVFCFCVPTEDIHSKASTATPASNNRCVAAAVAAAAHVAVAAGAPGKQFLEHPRYTLISQVAQPSQVAATAT